jgi:predicted SAM-dependent methyltransferase
MSETAKCRARLAPYCSGQGLDLGFGGDPIVPWAICFDLPQPYAHEGAHPQHLFGDARDLSIFSDNSLDFIFSSHLLEDFEDTDAAIREWARVLKPGGNLVIYCPDEPRYRKHCTLTGQIYNEAHKHDYFGLDHVRRAISKVRDLYIVHTIDQAEDYSFEIVARKR